MARHQNPQLHRAAEKGVAEAPAQRASEQLKSGARQGRAGAAPLFFETRVEKEIIDASLEAAEGGSGEPGQARDPQIDWGPGGEGFRLAKTARDQIRPDRNAGIGREYVGGERDVVEARSDAAHEAQGFAAVAIGFSGESEDEIEGDANSGALALTSGFADIGDVLVLLVHRAQHFGRCGFSSEADV